MEPIATNVQILDVAERIVRTRGFNGFSYADVAAEIGIRKASLHYHFPTKTDLGLKLITRFSESVLEALEEIAATYSSNLTRLREYARIYEGSLHDNKMCLCGMFAAEHESISTPMQQAITEFFNCHEQWLENVLEQGRKSGELSFNGSAVEHGRLIVANLQGALLIAKSLGSTERLAGIASNLVEVYRNRN